MYVDSILILNIFFLNFWIAKKIKKTHDEIIDVSEQICSETNSVCWSLKGVPSQKLMLFYGAIESKDLGNPWTKDNK